MYTCNNCKVQACLNPDNRTPNNCPSLEAEDMKKAKDLYQDESMKIAHMSAEVEVEGYCVDSRVIETIKFCKKMGYQKIGIAHCIGLVDEAKIFGKILQAYGLDYESVACKNGAVSKQFIGIPSDPDNPRSLNNEPMCNPIGQAVVLESSGCDIAVIMGLCVGHDTLFMKHCNLPMTTLVVKDRVLGHNPVAALYQAHSYYEKKLFPQK